MKLNLPNNPHSRQTGHPFEAHEEALHSLLRFWPRHCMHPRPSNDEAVQALYDAATAAAARVCRHIHFVPYQERAVEAVHEWFCKLRPHSVRGYDLRRPLFPLAYMILIRIIYKMARAHRQTGVSLAFEPATDEDDPVCLAEYSELRDLVGELPESLRRALGQRYFHGKTAKETAQALSITVNAVNIRTHRAVERLRIAFESD
jgi:RNA polymerase sigma factor (sigma-70 family)